MGALNGLQLFILTTCHFKPSSPQDEHKQS